VKYLRSIIECFEELHLDKEQVRIDGFRTDGTSNYLINLNYSGITWAVALRIPAKGVSVEEFLREKRRALEVAQYLARYFSAGIQTSAEHRFVFDGVSYLVDPESAKEFLRKQSTNRGLVQRNLVQPIVFGPAEKRIAGKSYPADVPDSERAYFENYDSPFYLSKGAPAWETGEDFPHLVPELFACLGFLHRQTGCTKPITARVLVPMVEKVCQIVSEEANRWEPTEDSSAWRAFGKLRKKWRVEPGSSRDTILKQEVFIRTGEGNRFFMNALESLAKPHVLSPGMCFSHGDMHCGNFVCVRYAFEIPNHVVGVPIDRTFVNEIFDRRDGVTRIFAKFSRADNLVTYSLEEEPEAVGLTKRDRFDIHLIDIDRSAGITPKERVPHIRDLSKLVYSARNILDLAGVETHQPELVERYYSVWAES
jgi:hypothetical protein